MRALPIALALLALLTASCWRRTQSPAYDPDAFTPPPAQEPIRLVLPRPTADPLDLADYRGRALLVLAFTTDNLASQALVRNLERVARRHPDDLAVVAIAGDAGNASTLRVTLDAYRQVADLQRVELAVANDDVRNGTSALGPVEHVPTLFFVNRAGVIVRRLEALLSEAQIEALVAPALPPR